MCPLTPRVHLTSELYTNYKDYHWKRPMRLQNADSISKRYLQILHANIMAIVQLMPVTAGNIMHTIASFLLPHNTSSKSKNYAGYKQCSEIVKTQ